MRILQISSARSIGGGERHVLDLSNELTKRGHDIFVAVVPGSPLLRALSRVPPGNLAEFPLRNALDLSTAVKIARLRPAIRHRTDQRSLCKRLSDRRPCCSHRQHSVYHHATCSFSNEPSASVSPAQGKTCDRTVERSGGTVFDRNDLFPDEKIVTIRYGLDVDRFPERIKADHANAPPSARSETSTP